MRETKTQWSARWLGRLFERYDRPYWKNKLSRYRVIVGRLEDYLRVRNRRTRMITGLFMEKLTTPHVRAVAIKRGQDPGEASGFQEMGTLRCDSCGEEFSIRHHPKVANRVIADKQAYWLEKVLAEEHERDKKHSDRIELPD